MINLQYANANTPTPGSEWLQLSDVERHFLVIDTLEKGMQFASSVVSLVSVTDDGQIIMSFLTPQSAKNRGQLLLDIEDFLKAQIDPGITVWLEQLGDRNSLRNLRGIEVK